MPEMPIVAFDDDDTSKLADVKNSLTLERKKAVSKANHFTEPDSEDEIRWNYWAGQVSALDLALSYIDAAERDL